MTTTETASSETKTASLIQQIAALQAEVDKQKKENESTIAQLKAENGVLKKSESEKMKTMWDDVVKPWFMDSINGKGEIAEHFQKSIDEAIGDARSRDGVWQIALCASARHKELIDKVNELSQRVANTTATFDDERKRTASVAATDGDDADSNDVFSAFKRRCL